MTGRASNSAAGPAPQEPAGGFVIKKRGDIEGGKQTLALFAEQLEG